jgi:hypothetical protein
MAPLSAPFRTDSQVEHPQLFCPAQHESLKVQVEPPSLDVHVADWGPGAVKPCTGVFGTRAAAEPWKRCDWGSAAEARADREARRPIARDNAMRRFITFLLWCTGQVRDAPPLVTA